MNKSTEVKSNKIKTLIIENHEVTAIGTKQILESQCPYLKPIGIALNAEEARELVNAMDHMQFIHHCGDTVSLSELNEAKEMIVKFYNPKGKGK